MAEEIVKYEDKVKKLLFTWQYFSNFKLGPKKVKVTSSSVVISGEGMIQTKGTYKGPKYHEDTESRWDVTIPMSSIVNVYHESYKAEGAMHYDKETVGIDAKVDDSIMSYAIFTKNAQALFQVIQSSRPQ